MLYVILKNQIMRIRFYCLITLLLSITLHFYAQERVNQVRPKLSASMDAQSEILSNVPGWSLIENSEGKFWNKSDLSDEISYLPAYKKSFAGFYLVQLFKFTIEGQHFCVLVKNIDRKKIKYFVFDDSELSMLMGATMFYDGIVYYNDYVVDLKYCDYVDGDFDPEVEILKNKELIRVLLLNEKRTISSLECSGERLFNFEIQKIKSDTIIRFNFILNLNENQPFITSKNYLSITNDYFETKLSNFTRLLNFSPYVNFTERKLRLEIIEKQKDSLQFQPYLEFYEKQNKLSTKKWDDESRKTINFKDSDLNGNKKNNVYKCIEETNSYPQLLQNNIDLTQFVDSSKIDDNVIFEIVIGSDGNVLYSPKQMNLFTKLKFKPGTIDIFYENIREDGYVDKNYNKYKTINRTMSIPVFFNLKKIGANYSFDHNANYEINRIIIKLKKTNKGIEIENKYFTNKEFYDSIIPKLLEDKNFGKIKNGKYYLYFNRKKFTWNIIIPEKYNTSYDSNNKSNYFYTYTDEVDIKVYNNNNIEKLCP